MTMLELAIEAIGWAAALLILAAYALLSAGKLTARRPRLSVDECARGDRLHRQLGVERSDSLGGAQCHLGRA